MAADSERRPGQVCAEVWRKEPPLLSKARQGKAGGRKTIPEANLRGRRGGGAQAGQQQMQPELPRCSDYKYFGA